LKLDARQNALQALINGIGNGSLMGFMPRQWHVILNLRRGDAITIKRTWPILFEEPLKLLNWNNLFSGYMINN